jgi:hypothetical protein
MSRPLCFATRSCDSIAFAAHCISQAPPQDPETAQNTRRHRFVRESDLHCNTRPVPGRKVDPHHPPFWRPGTPADPRRGIGGGAASAAATAQAGSLLPPMQPLVSGSDPSPPPSSAQPQQAHPGCSLGTALPGSRSLCTLRHARHLPPARKHMRCMSAPPDACLQSVRSCPARLGRPRPSLPPVQNRNLVKRPKDRDTKFRVLAAKTAKNRDLV